MSNIKKYAKKTDVEMNQQLEPETEDKNKQNALASLWVNK